MGGWAGQFQRVRKKKIEGNRRGLGRKKSKGEREREREIYGWAG